MKKVVKKIKKLGIRGFTLIELLGVLVIMGILILVVMPNMRRLINRNEGKDYSTYYDLIEYGATQYADELKSKLGTTHDTGCAQVSLAELIDKEYVTEFSKKDVSCFTGNNQIKIRNNNGKITVNFSLQCKKNGEEVYYNGSDDSTACVAYETSDKPSLVNYLEELNKNLYGNDYYINTANNYVRFSGQNFRIISYDKTYNTVRAVSAIPVTPLRFNSSNSTTFANSDLELWLNNDYLNSLQPDYKQYLVSYNWKVSSTTTRKANVGLLSREDISHVHSSIKNSTLTWLIDNGTSGSAYIVSSSSIESQVTTFFFEVQPVIVFNADTLYYGGTGTLNDPIRVSPDTYGVVDQHINERYAGEYVKINNKRYKILATGEFGAKVMYDESNGLGKKPFSTEDGEGSLSYLFDASTLGLYLNNQWFETLGADKGLLTDGDFCLETINGTTTNRLKADCYDTSTIKSLKVGLPKLGEPYIFSANTGTTFYWTVNPNTVPEGEPTYTNATINAISGGGSIGPANIKNSTDIYVFPVLYIKPEVQIAGGKGTQSNPYTLK